MGSNSIPPKTPSDESINRGLVCAYMHFIARTQKRCEYKPRSSLCIHAFHRTDSKDPDVHVLDG